MELTLYVIITIVLFLVCREIVCWYFKLNRNVANQEDVKELLTKILEELERRK